MQLSKLEWEVSTETQRAAFLSRVPEEPPEGQAGNAKICFHVGPTQVRTPPSPRRRHRSFVGEAVRAEGTLGERG